MASKLYGLDDNYEKNLPENKFLKQYKFVDDNLRFINKDGKLVDQDGRLIDENGRYINQNGEYVDKEGNLVDDKGDYVVQFQPFLMRMESLYYRNKRPKKMTNLNQLNRVSKYQQKHPNTTIYLIVFFLTRALYLDDIVSFV